MFFIFMLEFLNVLFGKFKLVIGWGCLFFFNLLVLLGFFLLNVVLFKYFFFEVFWGFLFVRNDFKCEIVMFNKENV